MLERRELKTCAVHLFAPEIPENGDVDVHDEAVWAQGNPGLAVGIKSLEWMRDEARRGDADRPF